MSRASSKPKSDYSIQAVTNALRLLEAFGDNEDRGVSELARSLDLHKNAAFRLLATLEENGYIEQSDRSERYMLGVRCLELGRSFSRSRQLLSCARPILEELTARVGESTHLGVMRDFEVVHLDGVQPRHLVVTASRVGRRLPAHCTALGKVLLGCADRELRQAYDRRLAETPGLDALTHSTVVDPHKLIEQLRGVSAQGFGVDAEECEVGLCCAAAPVYDESGRASAALSISAPAFRWPEEALIADLVPLVVDAAGRLSRALGHTS